MTRRVRPNGSRIEPRTAVGLGSRGRARSTATAIVVLGYALAQAGLGLASPAALPDPCAAVPSALVASALGVKHAPAFRLTSVNNTATCSYGTSLTVFVGLTAIVNPALPLRVSAVAGLPHGSYMTFRGSTQTEIRFVVGGTANGVYGVVRNYVRIPKPKLVKIAKALDAAMAGQSGTSTTPASVHLVTG